MTFSLSLQYRRASVALPNSYPNRFSAAELELASHQALLSHSLPPRVPSAAQAKLLEGNWKRLVPCLDTCQKEFRRSCCFVRQQAQPYQPFELDSSQPQCEISAPLKPPS